MLSRQCRSRFLSTLSLRRATAVPDLSKRDIGISIHALLAESDPITCCPPMPRVVFLSTLSLRRATGRQRPAGPDRQNFYPRSPCGERHYGWSWYDDFTEFLSTLSLRRATVSIHFVHLHIIFLSTLSLRRATTQSQIDARVIPISIHALLAESDLRGCPAWSPRPYFYPRSPCGERLILQMTTGSRGTISIHALLAESDQSRGSVSMSKYLFLSTLSLRRATSKALCVTVFFCFLSTLSLRRATL